MQTIRVAILGQGRSGRDIHGAHLSRDSERYRIAAVVDPLPERRERAQAEYGCEAFADYTELLGRDDLDLIVNAAPSKFHVPVTLALLEHGFSVLCEKPLAARTADVDRLIDASRQSDRLLAVFQQSRFSPFFRKVQEVIASGVLGDVVQINIAYDGFSRRYDWQTLISEMAGSLLNTGPHPLDQALQFFGPETMPDVSCVMRNATGYGDAEDHVLLVLRGEGHPIIRMEVSSCCRFPTDTYQVYATRGGLRADGKRVEWQYYDPASAPELALTTTPLVKADGTPAYCSDSLTWIAEEWLPSETEGQFESMAAAFYAMLYRTLTAGEPLEVTPQQVRLQIAVIEECQRQNPQIYKNATRQN